MKKILIIVAVVLILAVVVMSILKSGTKAEATVESGRIKRKDLVATVDCSGTIRIGVWETIGENGTSSKGFP